MPSKGVKNNIAWLSRTLLETNRKYHDLKTWLAENHPDVLQEYNEARLSAAITLLHKASEGSEK